ncbi:hypothetical protein UFOVP354_60 [uncultured Caudovirales phage]|uniref:Uncharacterized protein n=1 Tax=uncultured Caudovirales phage TaxID=2100421 RepID=A0A6J5M2S1_9CAUD|nr:hypothetical protein UFOVP354_60 [uncultured Caudovirales phage]
MTITPYEPNPAKAIAECKGDINKLAMAFEVHKCRSVFTELHLASVVYLLERQCIENLNSTDALILRRAKEHVHAIQHKEASHAA